MSESFGSLCRSSMSLQTSRPVIFVMLHCRNLVNDEEASRIDSVYEAYCESFDELWPNHVKRESLIEFVAKLRAVLSVNRNKLVDKILDLNRKVRQVRDSRGELWLMPLDTVQSFDSLVKAPEEWNLVTVEARLVEWMHPRPSLWASVDNDPPQMDLARDIQTIQDPILTTSVHSTISTGMIHGESTRQESTRQESTRQESTRDQLLKSTGHVYLMIDTTERADKCILFKLGMTGPNQSPLDRLLALRTGNPNLMLSLSAMVKTPRLVESRLFEMAQTLAVHKMCRGSSEFFLLKPQYTLFDLSEAVLQTIFAYRLVIKDLSCM